LYYAVGRVTDFQYAGRAWCYHPENVFYSLNINSDGNLLELETGYMCSEQCGRGKGEVPNVKFPIYWHLVKNTTMKGRWKTFLIACILENFFFW
jgi:hypothetical protein